MHDDLIEYEGGDILANLEERTITGLLIPFNELGQTNAGRFMVEAGAVALPSDPAVISLNTDHERSQNVGRASRVWETAKGIMATFKMANTPEGDAALADALSPTGKRRRLSGEFHTAIHAGKAVPGSGRLWGGALVPMGAFPSAMVLAADRNSSQKYVTEYTDAGGVVWRRVETTETTTAETDTGVETTSVTTVTESTEGEPTMPEPTLVTATAVAPVIAPVATVAPTILAQLDTAATTPVAPAATTQPVDETATVLATLASYRNATDPRGREEILAAIADITMSGTNTLPGTNVLRPNWLGKLYQGMPYAREYVQLCNLGTDISAAGKLGMKVYRGTAASPLGPQDGTWQGNKNPINGYRGDSNTVGSLLYKFAVGNDIDRSLYDLTGGEEVVREFLQLIIEDYLFWSDRIARETILAAAAAPVAAKAYPTIYTTNGTTALGMLIQGILAVRKRKADGRRDQPTFAILNDLAFEQIAYAVGGDQNLPAFITLALSALNVPQSEIGQLGNVIAVNGDNGITGTPSVTVGSKMGIDFDELAGGPLVIDAIDLARGGIDKATHGYFQTFTKRPESFVTIGTADAWAGTTAVVTGQYMKNGAATLQATNAGATAAAAPTNPAVGATVTDGTVIWKRVA